MAIKATGIPRLQVTAILWVQVRVCYDYCFGHGLRTLKSVFYLYYNYLNCPEKHFRIVWLARSDNGPQFTAWEFTDFEPMATDTFLQHHTILPRMAQLKGSSRPLNTP